MKESLEQVFYYRPRMGKGDCIWRRGGEEKEIKINLLFPLPGIQECSQGMLNGVVVWDNGSSRERKVWKIKSI